MWKYVQAGLGDARTILVNDACKDNLPPSTLDSEHPFVSNAQIAGYIGYVELAKLAGQPYMSQENTLKSMMAQRASGFTENNPWGGAAPPMPGNNRQALAVAQNFMWMTPELAQYLYNNANSKVQTALDHYRTDAPYWFVSKFEAAYREATNQQLYDNWGLFAMKAWFAPAGTQIPREELAKYLDTPAVARGDLYYLQNLIATIQAPSSSSSASAADPFLRPMLSLPTTGFPTTNLATTAHPPGITALEPGSLLRSLPSCALILRVAPRVDKGCQWSHGSAGRHRLQ